MRRGVISSGRPIEGDKQIPRLCWRDNDFSYLKGLPPNVQRLATLYEYARESDEITEAVKNVEHDHDLPDNLREVYRIEELEFLASTVGFPNLSFKKVYEAGTEFGRLLGPRPTKQRIHISSVKEGERMRRVLGYGSLTEYCEDPFEAGLGRYLIGIPWELSNGEIVRQFKTTMPKFRPPSFHQSSPGRRGTTQTTSGMDALRQLSAYRIEQSGGTFTRRSGFADYESKKGWQKAVTSARRRIEALSSRHLLS